MNILIPFRCKKIIILTVLALLSSYTAFGENSDYFTFSPSWYPAEDSPVNLSWLNRQHPLSRLFVNSDGHLADGSGRVRLVGMNVTAIPEKKDAALVASRLSSMGVNIVRLHHIDAPWTTNSLYAGDWNNPATEISMENLDKLDYFLNELAGENIMVNLNFLTGRDMRNLSSLPGFIRYMKDWKEIHTLGFFRPEVLELEKNNIKALMEHKNTYRNKTYAEDSLIAMVEIINENGLVHSWQTGWLDAYADEDNFLKNQWNSWLRQKFGTQQQLEAKLNPDRGQTNVLFDLADFSADPAKAFHLENHQGAGSELTGQRGRNPSLQLKVKKPGLESWHIQFGRSGIPVEQGKTYTLTFSARSGTGSEMSVNLSMAASPWQNLGFDSKINLEKGWNSYSFLISPTQDYRNARIMFSGFGLAEKAQVELKDIRLFSGGSIMPEGQTIDRQNLDWPRKKTAAFSLQLKKEWIEFLYQTEQKYWSEMKSYTESACGYEGIVIGTIIGTTTQMQQADFELIDAHAYFNHPVFTQKPWDMNHYYVKNRSLVSSESLDILSSLADKRVAGKPFIVSEIDQPAPNEYNPELFPILSAFALAQDWDGYFAFTFDDDDGNWDSKRISGFFDNVRNPAKGIAFRNAALAFRRGDFPAFKTRILYPIDRKKEIDIILKNDWGWNFGDIASLGWDRTDSLKAGIAVTADKAAVPDKPDGPAFDDTGISFDSSKRWFTAESERTAFCAGLFPKDSWKLGNFSFSGFSSLTGYGYVSVQTFSGTLAEPADGRILLSASVNSINTAMGLRDYSKGSDFRLLTTNPDFGTAPVLSAAPKGTVTMESNASSVEVYALDEQGVRSKQIPVTAKGNLFTFVIGKKYKTLWYEIVLK